MGVFLSVFTDKGSILNKILSISVVLKLQSYRALSSNAIFVPVVSLKFFPCLLESLA